MRPWHASQHRRLARACAFASHGRRRHRPPQAADPTPFKIGISAPVVTIFPVWMGEAGGFYEKEGLKVEVINMEGGTRGLQVLLSGEIQGMHVGLAPVVLANKQGADLRLVTSTCNTIPITMFSTAGDQSMGDLKGKTFGISTFGSETDIAISILLKKLGLTRQDVTVSQIGGSSQRFGALIAGRIDVAPLIEPGITMAKEKGFNPLVDLAAAKTPWIFDSVVVTSSYLKGQRDTLTRFVRGVHRRRLSRAVRREEGEGGDRAEVQDQRSEGHRRPPTPISSA